jgi:hypothetical protein
MMVGAFFTVQGRGDSEVINAVTVRGGSLLVTNALGTGDLSLGIAPSHLELDSGTVVADRVNIAPGALYMYPQYGPNRFVFNGGSVRVKELTLTNGIEFAIGDGKSEAELHALDGKIVCPAGLFVRTNAVLSGCFTVDGDIRVQGAIRFDSGTSIIRGKVFNEGRIETTHGASVAFEAPVVNNGLILSTNGTVRFNAGATGTGMLKQ